ncbi:aspartic protease [Aphelenchoides avenae]|nr:aspartic protease [Aphelenchus avenae]
MISIWSERKPFGLSVANASVTFGAIDDHCTWGKKSFFVDLTEPKPATQSDPWSATWMFQLDSITFQGNDGAKSKVHIARNATVWIWHGILAPWDDLEPIAKKLRATYDGVRGYVADCSNLKRLPTLYFMIGQRSIGLEPLEYTYEVDGTCYLSFKATEWFFYAGSPQWIVGTHFFTNHCFVGDFGANRIGFAEKKKARP